MKGVIDSLQKALVPFVDFIRHVTNSKDTSIFLANSTKNPGEPDILYIDSSCPDKTLIISCISEAGQSSLTVGDFKQALKILENSVHTLKFSSGETRLINSRSETEILHRLISYEKAIKFYAEESNWTVLNEATSYMDPRSCPVAHDRGSIARKALGNENS